MKSTFITIIITALTVTTIGLCTKLVLNNNNANKATKRNPEIIASATTASAPTIVEKPKIISVNPKYDTVQVPYNKCHMVNQNQIVANANKSGAIGGVIGTTTGAVAGGVIGKQIGGGTAGTLIGGAIGAIGGAIAGNQIQKATQPNEVSQTNLVQQCSIVNKSIKKLVGYNVIYNYQGESNSVVLKNKPTEQYLPLSAIN